MTKPSEFQKIHLLWAVWLLLIGAAGWVHGAHPHLTWQSLFPNKEPILILASSQAWVPQKVIERLTKDLEREIRVEAVEEYADYEARLIPVDSAHLLWLPSSWAQVLGKQGLLTELSSLNSELHQKISADFLSQEDEHPFFIPMLWSIEKNSLRVEGLAVPHSGRQSAAALLVINDWLKVRPAMAQVKELDGPASTLTTLDDRDLPMAKKAMSLRNRDFRGLKIR